MLKVGLGGAGGGRRGDQKPSGFRSDEGKLANARQKNITCTLSPEMHLSFLVGATHIKEHSGHTICRFNLASTFKEAYRRCGPRPTGPESHSSQ